MDGEIPLTENELFGLRDIFWLPCSSSLGLEYRSQAQGCVAPRFFTRPGSYFRGSMQHRGFLRAVIILVSAGVCSAVVSYAP